MDRADDPSSQLRSVWRLAAPAIAQQLLHTAVFLVDRAMLGHFDADSLASMQISNPVVWSTFSLLSAFTVGSVAFVGRSIGGGRALDANAGLRTSAALATVLGLVVTFVGPLAIPLVTEVLFPAASAPVQAESAAYLGVALRSMPLVLVSFTLAVCLQAAGDTRTPFAVAAVGNLINVVLTWALVFGRLGLPSLGARGAAIGSAIAFAWETLALVGLLSGSWLRLSWRGWGGELDALRRMLRVSAASLGERALQHTGFLGFVAMIGALGPAAMAANQALISIESVVFLSADGFGIAAASLVAQRLGAGRPEDAAAAGRAATKLTVLVLGGVGIAIALFGSLLMRAFTNDPSIIALGAPCLYVAGVAAPLMGAAVVLSEALRGAGATREALGITFVGGLVVRLGATGAIVFWLGGGLLGVWIGSSIDWAVRAAIGRYVFAHGRWKTTRV